MVWGFHRAGIGILLFAIVACARLSAQIIPPGTYSGLLPGDTISSGTVTLNTGALFLTSNLNIAGSATLAWNLAGSMTGQTVTVGTGSSYGYISVGNGSSLTFGNTTTVGGVFDIYGNTGSTIINQGGIAANTGSSTSYLYGPILTNQGTVTASNGASLYFGYYNGETTTNASGATITANGANSTIYLHDLSNQGTLVAQNNGVLQFTGANSTANLGTVSIASGGHIRIGSTLTNTTLNAPTGGSYELYGGTISGGTISAGALTFTTSGGTLNGASYTGDINLGTSESVTLTGGAAFTGANAAIGNSATLTWNQNGTLTGKTLTMGTGTSDGYINVGTNNSLTLDSSSAANGVFYIYGNSGSSIINQGAITANTASSTSYLYGPTLTNQGTVMASNGANLYFGYYNGETTTNASGATITADGTNSTIYLHNLTNQGSLVAQNNGVLQFTGANSSTDLGTATIASGGHIRIGGTLTNTTLVAPTGGSYELYGGTISGGTINAGALAFTSSGGTLSGATYTGDLTLGTSQSVTLTGGAAFTGANAAIGNSATLTWNQNGTLAGKTLTMGTGTSYGYINVGTNNSLTLDSATSTTGVYYIYGNTGSSIVNQGTITSNAANSTSYIYGPTLTNQGTVTANNGASLYFGYYNGETTTNASGATITADGTNSTIYLHNLSNQGSLVAQNSGVLQFTGTNSTTDLGTATIASGGHIRIGGTLTNTTLTAPTGGSYELYGGTVSGGTISSGALVFTTNGGTLSGASFTGDLTLGTSQSVTLTGGAAFTGTNATIANSATLTWNQNGTLAGKTLTMGTGTSYGYIGVGNGNSLTLGSGSTMTGVFDLYGNTGATIINQGAITANTAGSTSYLYGPTLTNQGTITANNGANLYLGYYSGETTTNASGGTITADGSNSTIYLNNLSNQGSLVAQNNGVLQFTGTNSTTDLGTATIASGGHIRIGGTLNNTTLNAPTGGSYELYGGTISGGTVSAGALTFTSSGGYLDGASFTGDLSLPASTYARFLNGAAFTGANATLANNAGLYWQQVGTLSGKTITQGTGSYLYVAGAGNTLTIAPTTSITGSVGVYTDTSTGTAITNQGTLTHNSGTGYLYANTLVNQGSVAVTGGSLYFGYYAGHTSTIASGGSLTLTGSSNVYVNSPLTNAGQVLVQNGTLYTYNNLFTNAAGGLLGGAGTINGDLTIAGGTVSPGNSIGTLTISNSDFLVTGSSIFSVEMDAVTADKLSFQNPTSSVNIGAGLMQLSINLLAAPTQGVNYTIMNISSGGSGISGYFAGLPNNGDTLTATFGAQNYTLNVYYLGNAIMLQVPEPSTYALMGAGLALFALQLRRRKARS